MTTLSTHDVRAYLVGGAVRDRIRGIASKDWDFAVEAPSFHHMDEWLQDLGFRVFVRTPQFLTIRARCETPIHFAGLTLEHQTFDFALCRRDGIYTDGRRPDSVKSGTILEDLSRRDFTCNAVALAEDGSYLDPHDGIRDIGWGVLRLVGGPERLVEDGLRVIRALRFFVTTGFDMDGELVEALESVDAILALCKVSPDRIRDELNKMFKHDPFNAVKTLSDFESVLHVAINKGVWFKATSETR